MFFLIFFLGRTKTDQAEAARQAKAANAAAREAALLKANLAAASAKPKVPQVDAAAEVVTASGSPSSAGVATGWRNLKKMKIENQKAVFETQNRYS